MNRTFCLGATRALPVPRARGDEPEDEIEARIRYAPFPALAGMNRWVTRSYRR